MLSGPLCIKKSKACAERSKYGRKGNDKDRFQLSNLHCQKLVQQLVQPLFCHLTPNANRNIVFVGVD